MTTEKTLEGKPHARGARPSTKVAWTVAACAYACACGAIVTEPLPGGGTALIVNGTAYASDEKAALNGNTVSELWKTGTSTLVSEGIGSFTGVIRLKGGVFQVAAQAGLGTVAGATYVESGATLEQTSNDAQLSEPVYLEGNGVDGMGAYYSSDNATQKSPGLKGPVTLTGDALLVGLRQWYLNSSNLDMGGHLLVLSNINHQCIFKPAQITNAGHILVTMGTIWVSNGANLNNGPENTLTLTNSAAMSVYGYKTLNAANWTIRYCTRNGGNSFYISSTSTAAPSHWYGPVEIPAGFTMRASLATGNSDYAGHLFMGPIFGDGNFSVVNGNTLESVKLYGTNTYTGTTSMPNSGMLWFMHRKALPSLDPTKYTTPPGTGKMFLPLRADGSTESFVGWTADDLKEVYDAFDAASSGEHAYPLLPRVESGETFTYPHDYDASHNYYCRQRYCGGGTVKLTGDFIGRPRLWLESDVDDGTTVEIDGAGESRQNEYGRIDFYNGRFLLKNMAPWFTSEQDGLAKFDVAVRSTSPKSRVTFGPGVSMGQELVRKTEAFDLVYNNGTCGTLELLDGCAFTNRLIAAYNANQSAAVYQRGGDVYLTNGGSNDGHMGYGGYCFYEKTGGAMRIRAWTRFGFTRSGAGIFHGTSDWQSDSSSLAFSAGGTGILYQTSGKLSALGTEDGALAICNANYATAWGGLGVVTVRGPNACVYVKNDAFYMSDCSISKSFVNMLDGGTMQVAQLRKQGEKTFRTGNDISNAYAYVNFDGGVLKSTGKNVNLFGAGAKAPDRVTVFSGGAIIDSDAYAVTNNAALQAPTGKGVVSIALPEGFDATGYIGPPVVSISGDGTGATAVCEYDTTNQVVTGITVTSPGWDYTEATATLSRGGKSGTVACTVTLADNDATGGLTKRGAGTLVLAEANTYGGTTRLEGGTLVLAHAQGYPGGDLEIPAATLRGTLSAPLLTANSLTFAAGKGVSVTEADTLDENTFGPLRTVATFAEPIAQPSLTLVDSDGDELPPRGIWHLLLADGGRTLKFGALRGTQILIR